MQARKFATKKCPKLKNSVFIGPILQSLAPLPSKISTPTGKFLIIPMPVFDEKTLRDRVSRFTGANSI